VTPREKLRDPIAVAYGRRVRDAREALGITQEELGRRVKTDRTAIVKIENGDRSVGRIVARRLATELGGTPEEWVTFARRSAEDVVSDLEVLRRLEALEAEVAELRRERNELVAAAVERLARLEEAAGIAGQRSTPRSSGGAR
jgi:transcriptional regulator with XRE-family HTH domain